MYISDDNEQWTNYTSARARDMRTFPPCSVTLTGGAHATVSGGNTTQTVGGAMTEVIYTANEGYAFPKTDSAYGNNNGVMVEVSSNYKTITVSGTPEADVAITIPDAEEDKGTPIKMDGGTLKKGESEWTVSNNTLPLSSGTYYLDSDITTQYRIAVTGNVTLDLNGYGISCSPRYTCNVIHTVSGSR